MVVSFMIVVPFSLVVVVRFDRTAAPISSVVALVALSATGHPRSTLVPAPNEGLSHEMDQFTGPGGCPAVVDFVAAVLQLAALSRRAQAPDEATLEDEPSRSLETKEWDGLGFPTHARLRPVARSQRTEGARKSVRLGSRAR